MTSRYCFVACRWFRVGKAMNVLEARPLLAPSPFVPAFITCARPRPSMTPRRSTLSLIAILAFVNTHHVVAQQGMDASIGSIISARLSRAIRFGMLPRVDAVAHSVDHSRDAINSFLGLQQTDSSEESVQSRADPIRQKGRRTGDVGERYFTCTNYADDNTSTSAASSKATREHRDTQAPSHSSQCHHK